MRRENAEKRKQEAQWSRAEWFDTRERKMEDFARLWDGTGAGNEQ
ncbi:hypothetical protein OG206_22225 [Streptomyces sp. NBC_01341]|nr:hypothetical protein OG206_22225 [Streptomyces sp. NBC_01341]